MADRGKGKSGRAVIARPSASERTAPRVAASAPASAKPPQSLAGENERLKAELAAAQARIVELEHQRSDAIHRIDWVVDQLKELLASR